MTPLLLAGVLLTGGCTGGGGPAAPPGRPSAAPPTGAELKFARMMIVHHAQAVWMSRTLLAKGGLPERITALADYVRVAQGREITELNRWLVAWGAEPVPADYARAARTPGIAHGAGHGMLGDARLAELAGATGPAAARCYLRLLIDHHQGAIVMGRAMLRIGRNAFVRAFAQHIVNEQSAEITAMRGLLGGQQPTSRQAAERLPGS